MRLALKFAILAAGKTQRQVAAETDLLTENRLSEIVNRWVEPTEQEKAALACVLQRFVGDLFEDGAPGDDSTARRRRMERRSTRTRRVE